MTKTLRVHESVKLSKENIELCIAMFAQFKLKLHEMDEAGGVHGRSVEFSDGKVIGFLYDTGRPPKEVPV
jgi:formate dehydrogenase assembly factor FdhD